MALEREGEGSTALVVVGVLTARASHTASICAQGARSLHRPALEPLTTPDG